MLIIRLLCNTIFAYLGNKPLGKWVNFGYDIQK